MLEENVRLRLHWPRYCGCLFTFNAFVVPPQDDDLQDFLAEKRRSLSKQVRSRLAQSMTEGELPAGANCDALANLCSHAPKRAHAARLGWYASWSSVQIYYAVRERTRLQGAPEPGKAARRATLNA